MKKLFVPAFLIGWALLGSCTWLLKKSYGIKKPKVETANSVRSKAMGFGLDTSNIVTVKSTEFKEVLQTHKNIPDADIFDSEGKYIEYRATDTSCNAGLFGFIPALSKEKQYNKTGLTTLEKEKARWLDLQGKPLRNDFIRPADFYVVIYWTTWTGKLNKDHVKAWEKLAHENKNASIQVIKVDLDYQSHWPEADQKAAMKKR